MHALVQFARLDINRQLHIATGSRTIAIVERVQFGRNHGKQITRLGEWINPSRIVPPAHFVTVTLRIAIRQQHRESSLIGMHGNGIPRHHIGSVHKPGDASETLRFALSEIAIGTSVQTGELGVFIGLYPHCNFQHKCIRRIRNRKFFSCQNVFACGER